MGSLIADFTPGVDKIGLAVSGDSGFNRKDFSKDDVSFVQGTGDMAAILNYVHWRRGFKQGIRQRRGDFSVLFDTDASTYLLKQM